MVVKLELLFRLTEEDYSYDIKLQLTQKIILEINQCQCIVLGYFRKLDLHNLRVNFL